jgi:hypothetical protein
VNSGGFDSPEMTFGLTPATRFASIRRSSRLTESGVIGTPFRLLGLLLLTTMCPKPDEMRYVSPRESALLLSAYF